jgi:hypothetical protein
LRWGSAILEFWQLGDVARYAPSFIERQRLGDWSIARIGMAVEVTEALAICVENLEESPSISPWRAGASSFEHGGVIQRLSAALWELILLGAPQLAIDPRPIGRQ